MRLLIDAPAAGAWNMALDETLLVAADRECSCTLRFYRWSVPTLSLGYFQSHLERQSHAASLDCPLVRRASGGGAIVHDRELTYSLATVPGHPEASPTALYDHVHLALAEALADWGIRSRLCDIPHERSQAQPFLCFQRRARGDLILGGFKVCGSAQRRRRAAILQHGSVLLARSAAAPELPGIAELADREIEHGQLIRAWSERLAARLGAELAPGEISAVEAKFAARLERERYAAPAWTLRR